MGHKLLLADDSITIQKVVGIIFSNDDYDLTIVDNGNAALEKARETVPDIMLVDAIMPGKNGYDVCREVRRDPKLAGVPLLLLTGVFEPFDENKAKESGADDFISKPFESQQLIDKVKTLVETGKGRAAAAPAPAVAAVAAAPAAVPPPTPFAPEPAAAEPVFDVAAFAAPEPASFADPFAAGEPAAFDADVFAVEEPASFASEEPEADDVFAVEEVSGEWEAEEVVEALPEDDPWGTVELEEEGVEYGTVIEEEGEIFEEVPLQEEPFSFAETPAGAAPAPLEVPELEVSEEPFSFADELPVESGVGSSFSPEGETAFSFDAEPTVSAPVEEELFVFEDEAPEVVPVAPSLESFALPEEPPPFEFIDEPLLAAPSAAPVIPAPAVEPPPASEAFMAPPVMAPAAVAAPVPSFSPSGEVTLTEEQLAAVVSRISRDLIERIAWEVVPDLAETIIREEIAKIKAGT
jgi:CheY-like chemotaxis protein